MNFHGVEITDGNKALELLRTDPLSPHIPGWMFLRRRWCQCPPQAHHSDICPMTEMYAEVVIAIGLPDEMGRNWGLPEFGWGRVRYVCYADVERPHCLDMINGPTHYCAVLGDVVEPVEYVDPYPDYW